MLIGGYPYEVAAKCQESSLLWAGEPIAVWLNENVGEMGVNWAYTTVYYDHGMRAMFVGPTPETVFCFVHEADAAWFKLIWG